MRPVIIRCPECNAPLSSFTARQPGKLIDCPRCHLLFAPTFDDVFAPPDRGAAREHERRWADGDVPRPYPSTSPWSFRWRWRRLTAGELAGAAAACVVMMALAGLVVLIYFYYLWGPAPAVAQKSAPPLAASSPAAEAPRPARASAPEVEDDRSPSGRRPVPSLDDADTFPAPNRSPSSTPPRSSPPADTPAQRLLGPWESDAEAKPFTLEFQDGGKLLLMWRDGLDVSEVQGTWQAVDTNGRLRLRLKLGAVDDALEAVRLSLTRGDVDATFPGDDRLRLQGQGAAVVLQRRK
jgi:hypothetical protein